MKVAKKIIQAWETDTMTTWSLRWACIATAALLVLPPWSYPAHAENITYSLVNYPSYQNGWSLEGTITTDGTIGQIQPENIVDWDWTISKPGEMGWGDVLRPSWHTYCEFGLYASSTEFFLKAPQVEPEFEWYARALTYLKLSNWNDTYYINWGLDYYYAQTQVTGQPLVTRWSADPTPDPPNSDYLLVATTVPEPATLLLLATALMGLGVISFVRRPRMAKG